MTERKERFETIQRVAKYNTGHTPVAAESTIRQICCGNIGMDVSDYERHLKAVQQNNVMVVGSGYIWHPEEHPPLTDAIEWVVENADEPQAFVAAANRWRDAEKVRQAQD